MLSFCGHWLFSPARAPEVDGLGPTRLRFTFDRGLEDPSLTWIAFIDGDHQVVAPPAPGESLVLAGAL